VLIRHLLQFTADSTIVGFFLTNLTHTHLVFLTLFQVSPANYGSRFSRPCAISVICPTLTKHQSFCCLTAELIKEWSWSSQRSVEPVQESLQAVETRIADVQSLCSKRCSSLRRRIGTFQRPVQAVQPEPMSASTSSSVQLSPASKPFLVSSPSLLDSQQQLIMEEERRKWRPSLKGKVCMCIFVYLFIYLQPQTPYHLFFGSK